MSLLAHISDLHFGRVRLGAADALLSALEALAPDLVVISGDVTQRARPRQFQAARDFLERLRWPYLVVPGNHDLPLHRPLRRLFRPLQTYRQYISSNRAPRHMQDGLAVLGLNTTLGWRWKAGGLTPSRLEGLRSDLCPLPPEAWRVLVTHHPVVPPPEGRLKAWQASIGALARECRLDVALSGHLHQTVVRAWPRGGILAVEAGTALSSRLRGETNAFNTIRLRDGRVEVGLHALHGGEFIMIKRQIFRRVQGEWQEQPVSPWSLTQIC